MQQTRRGPQIKEHFQKCAVKWKLDGNSRLGTADVRITCGGNRRFTWRWIHHWGGKWFTEYRTGLRVNPCWCSPALPECFSSGRLSLLLKYSFNTISSVYLECDFWQHCTTELELPWFRPFLPPAHLTAPSQTEPTLSCFWSCFASGDCLIVLQDRDKNIVGFRHNVRQVEQLWWKC